MDAYKGGQQAGIWSSQQLLSAYRKQQVETASPVQLIVMLYDGAIRHCKGAQMAIAEQNREQARHHLLKAQDIVAELLSCLDMEKGGELAQALGRLYAYIHGRLVEANLCQDAEAAREAERLLSGLRDAWAQVASNRARGTGTPIGAQLPSG